MGSALAVPVLASVHPWNVGLLVIAPVILGMAVWAALAASASEVARDLWRRRIGRIAAVGAGAFALLAVVLALHGAGAFQALGVKATAVSESEAWAPPLICTALGILFALGCLGAFQVMERACRRGTGNALVSGGVLLGVLAAGSVALTHDGRRYGSGYDLPAILDIPRSMQCAGVATGILAALAGFAALFGLGQLMLRRDEETRRRARRLCLATGTAVALGTILWSHFLVLRVLVDFAILGPANRMSMLGSLRWVFERQYLLFAFGGLGMVALYFGLPALRRAEGEDGGGEVTAPAPGRAPPG